MMAPAAAYLLFFLCATRGNLVCVCYRGHTFFIIIFYDFIFFSLANKIEYNRNKMELREKNDVAN